jgi:hypothetical protein
MKLWLMQLRLVVKLLPSMIYSDEQNDHIQALLAYRHIAQTSVYDR